MSTELKPKKQCQCWFVPADVVHLFQDKKISALETLLFSWMLMESDSDPDGCCYANNERLAGELNCSEVTVSNALSKLKKTGLLRQVFFDGRVRCLQPIQTN